MQRIIERITKKLSFLVWKKRLIFGMKRYPAKIKAAMTEPVL
jgi:hypothetical protein